MIAAQLCVDGMASHRTKEKKMAKPKKPMVQQAEVRRSEETSQLAANGNTCALFACYFFPYPHEQKRR